MNVNVYISNHARQRIKERCGVSKKGSAERLCKLAVARGISADETKGYLKRWLTDRIIDENRKIYVHGDKAFVFDLADTGLVLVTVLQIPQELMRISVSTQKKNRRFRLRMSDSVAFSPAIGV